MRKLIAHITLAVFLWASVVSPAKAVMPLLGAAAVWFFNQTTATQIAIGGSVALHAAVAAITFTNDSSAPNTAGANKTLTVQLDPYVPLVNPESAATQPASIPATQEYPVISNVQYSWPCPSGMCGSGSFNIKMSSPAAQWSNMVAFQASIGRCLSKSGDGYNSESQYYWSWTTKSGACPGGSYLSSGTALSNRSATCATGSTWNGTACISDTATYSCPSGYTLSGTTCNLNGPTQVSDNKQSIIRSGNTFTVDPDDPDVLPSNVTVTSNKVKVENSNGRKDEIVIETDGTLSTYHWEPNTAGDTVQTKVSATAPSAGTPVEVTSIETKTFSGSSSTTGGSTGTATAATTTQVIGDVQLDKTGLASDSKQCGYDSAHPCKVEVDTSGLGNNDVSQTNFNDAAVAHQNHLETIGQGGDHGWSWDWNPLSTISTGSCTDPTFIINGKPYVDLTGFCSKVEWFRGFLEFMLYISTGIALFNIMTGRREEV